MGHDTSYDIKNAAVDLKGLEGVEGDDRSWTFRMCYSSYVFLTRRNRKKRHDGGAYSKGNQRKQWIWL